jgi:putative ABC transport system permease protein
MIRLRILWSRVRMVFRRREIEADLDEEIRSHLEMQEDDLRRSGMTAGEARESALRDFGGVDRAKERYRDRFRFFVLEDLCHDGLYALRVLRKSPGYTVTAVLTLALGIGASTAIFSVLQAVLLRPLPYRDPGRLAAVWVINTRDLSGTKMFATYADYEEFRRHATSFSEVSAATWAAQTSRVLTGYGLPREVLTIPASANFFDTLGVHAALGRTFNKEDEQRGCAIVLSQKLWASVFTLDASITGKTIPLDGKPCDVLGVMPKEFSFYPGQSEAWILLRPGFQLNQEHMFVGIFARLKPGVSLAQAQTELRGFFSALHTDAETRDFAPVVYDLHDEFTFLASRTLHSTLILVFASVLLVLLIACLNVANLLLARLSRREHEMAVRAALGSSRNRLLKQVLVESLVLSLLGALLGMGLAWGAIYYFRLYSPIELTVGADVAINVHVLLFGAIVSLLTTVIFGTLPAFRASRVDPVKGLKAAGRGVVRRGHRIASVLIGLEIAATFVLLVGAGLLMASALRMGSESLGFNPNGIFATRVGLPPIRYTNGAQRLAFYKRLLDRLERLPGNAGVALSSKVPPEAGGNQVLEIQGTPQTGGTRVDDIGADAVTARFFDLLNIPLLSGRLFDDRDHDNNRPVAIVNEALVREYFSNANPIGKQIRIPGGPMPWLTIIGVVGNLKHTELMNEMRWVETPIFYRPLAQEPRPSIQIAVRSHGDPAPLMLEVRQLIADLDPLIPAVDAELLNQRLSRTLAYPRFRAIVLGFFALTALFLSAVGLHGVLSQFVALRTADFAVRRAVGAKTSDLLWLVARYGGLPFAAGQITGIVLLVAFNRMLAGMLYGIRAVDSALLLSVLITLLLTATLAILFPARRAATVDPMVALRED